MINSHWWKKKNEYPITHDFRKKGNSICYFSEA